jgi:hypothetical protein
MRFWVRELAGWVLIALGLFMAFWVWVLALEGPYPRVLSPWPLTIFGIFVFRGGIHLLKVAIAARVCLQAQDRLYPSADMRPRPAAPLQRMGRGRGQPTT